MKLYDQDLEERMACAMATDVVVLDLADELECADFVTGPAHGLFCAVRDVQATGVEVTADAVAARIRDLDAQRDLKPENPFHGDEIYALLFAVGGPYQTITETVHAIRALVALRVRREKLIALDAPRAMRRSA